MSSNDREIRDVPESSVGAIAQQLVDAGYTTVSASKDDGVATWTVRGHR